MLAFVPAKVTPPIGAGATMAMVRALEIMANFEIGQKANATS